MVTVLKRRTSSLTRGPTRCVKTWMPPSPELEERQEQVVVPGVEREVGLGEDPASLVEVGRRLLDGPDARISASRTIVLGSRFTTTRCGML